MDFVYGNTLINRPPKDHGVDLLSLLDLKKTINIFFLILLKKHFKLESANKNCNVRLISDRRQENLKGFLAHDLTPTNITGKCYENSKSKSEKSHCKNSSRIVVAASLVKLIVKRNLRKGFFIMIFKLYTLFAHFVPDNRGDLS